MINHPAISSEVFQALYLNEDIYWVESDKPVTSQTPDSALNDETLINTEVIGIVNVVTLIPEKPAEIVVAIPQLTNPEIVKNKQKIIDNEIVEKRIIPLLLITDSITEADKVFLEKVLNAVKLSLNDIEVFTTDTLKTTEFRTYSIGKSYQRIISFGVPFTKIGLERMFMPYEIVIIKNIQFLLIEELIVVQNDVNHKRKFWGCLQQMF